MTIKKTVVVAVLGMAFTQGTWALELTLEQAELFTRYMSDLNQQNHASSTRRSGVKLSRLPTSVGSPSYLGNFAYFDQRATLTFWREVIDGSQRLFTQVQPTTAKFFFCPGGSVFSIVQSGTDFGKALNMTKGNDISFCDYLTSAGIFLVDQWSANINGANFQENQAFTISYADKNTSNYSGNINVGASTNTTDNSTSTISSSSCPSLSSIISSNLNIKIPNATYQPAFGSPLNLWAELQYQPTNDGKFWWTLSNYGINP